MIQNLLELKKALLNNLKIAIFAQIQVLKLFWPSRPIFPLILPPKCPNMMIGNVMGPHWYHYRTHGLLNMPRAGLYILGTCGAIPHRIFGWYNKQEESNTLKDMISGFTDAQVEIYNS